MCDDEALDDVGASGELLACLVPGSGYSKGGEGDE